MFTPHAERPGARPPFLAPLSKLASRLLPALSDAQHSSHSSISTWVPRKIYDSQHSLAATLSRARKKTCCPLTFPQPAKNHAERLSLCSVSHPLFPQPASPHGKEASTSQNSTCIYQASARPSSRPSKLWRAITLQPKYHGGLRPKRARCLGACRRGTHSGSFLLAYRPEAFRGRGAPFHFPCFCESAMWSMDMVGGLSFPLSRSRGRRSLFVAFRL